MNSIEKTILSLYGSKGQEWINNLPSLIKQIAKNWKLSHLQPMPNLSYNYVLHGLQNNTPIILKLGLDKAELQREASALGHLAAHGSIGLINQDLESGALLLERANPGQTLKTFFPERDELAIKIACKVIQQIQSAPKPDSKIFPNLSDRLTTLEKNWDIPQHFFTKARKLTKKLLATSDKLVLLHADLHHENILAHGKNGKKWVAIDPKGVIGDPIYEVCAFIRNPVPELINNPNAKNIIQKRIKLFAEILEFEEQRIRDWSYVQGLLAACWMIEDGLKPDVFIRFIELLET